MTHEECLPTCDLPIKTVANPDTDFLLINDGEASPCTTKQVSASVLHRPLAVRREPDVAQTVPPSTSLLVTNWGSVRFDEASLFLDYSLGEFTVLRPFMGHVDAAIRFASGPDGQRDVNLRVNGTSGAFFDNMNTPGTDGLPVSLGPWVFEVGDVIDVMAAQFSGIPLDVIAVPSSFFSVTVQRDDG